MTTVILDPDDLPPVDRPLLVSLITERIKSEWLGRGVEEMTPDVEAIKAQVDSSPDLVVQEQLKRFSDQGRVW